MSTSATITVTMPMSAAAHARRDAGGVKSVSDLYQIGEISQELEASCKTGQRRALEVAKKAGLTAVGRPDLSYGFHGGAAGPIEMWFQIRAEA